MIRPCLEDSFTLVDYWYLEKPGFFRLHNIETLNEDPDNPEFSYLYSDEDLEKLHPLLPKVMHGLLGLAQRTSGEGFVNGDHIGETLDYLQHGAVSFIDTGDMQRNFTRIDEIQLVGGTVPRVHVKGLNIYVQTVLVDGQETPLVENYSLLATQVTQAELDSRYPGWLDRWHLAHDLEMDKTFLNRYLFTTSPVGHNALPDVTFE